ncbi:ATP-binding protein [Micromonospora krabiensis]|uniref:Histidine kinase-like ATPase domain-containing protein n=1 Tax=Micromonospora krabiensis TaxID=307121 RepID=A0A1C3NB50_9ACTN|nr:ATP-binding protein [Micromonospora krabiensis]SBV29800.1 Histidine kinase-like ATPase domain-containing protein [Micromonospora krabiensis]
MGRTERTDARAATGRHHETILRTDLRCLVEADESGPVVRVTGVLDRSGTAAVRDALLDVLCARPGPVVADLTGLRIADPAARAVFADVDREVADWPAAGLLLSDPGATAGDPALGRTPVWPSLDGALAALAESPMAAVLNAELAPVLGAAREARELVADGCRRWGLPALAEPGTIAVTEMVNNVVAHARTPMTVRLAPDGDQLHLAVRDRSTRQPAFAGLAPPTSTGGRGLLLIDTVARRWGSTPVPDGKVVWCVLDPADQPPA